MALEQNEAPQGYIPARLSQLVPDLLALTVRAREALADGDPWLAEAVLEELETQLVGLRETALERADLLLARVAS